MQTASFHKKLLFQFVMYVVYDMAATFSANIADLWVFIIREIITRLMYWGDTTTKVTERQQR